MAEAANPTGALLNPQDAHIQDLLALPQWVAQKLRVLELARRVGPPSQHCCVLRIVPIELLKVDLVVGTSTELFMSFPDFVPVLLGEEYHPLHMSSCILACGTSKFLPIWRYYMCPLNISKIDGVSLANS